MLKAEDVAKWPPQPEKSYVKYDMMSEDCLYLSVTTGEKAHHLLHTKYKKLDVYKFEG